MNENGCSDWKMIPGMAPVIRDSPGADRDCNWNYRRNKENAWKKEGKRIGGRYK